MLYLCRKIGFTMQDERYLQLLSDKFPNSRSVVTELINLRAILSLPKGTEHFVSDLHGASLAFIHMIKNASGVVRKKVDEVYGDSLAEEEKRAICALIYYPDERLELIKRFYEKTPPPALLTRGGSQERENGGYIDLFTLNAQISKLPTLEDWYRRRLHQVVEVARAVTVKYSRSKVQRLLPKDYAYVISELLHESNLEQKDRQTYYNAVIDAIIETGCADRLIIAVS